MFPIKKRPVYNWICWNKGYQHLLQNSTKFGKTVDFSHKMGKNMQKLLPIIVILINSICQNYWTEFFAAKVLSENCGYNF